MLQMKGLEFMNSEKAIKTLEYTKYKVGMPDQGDNWQPNAETLAIDYAIEKIKENPYQKLIEMVEEEFGTGDEVVVELFDLKKFIKKLTE